MELYVDETGVLHAGNTEYAKGEFTFTDHSETGYVDVRHCLNGASILNGPKHFSALQKEDNSAYSSAQEVKDEILPFLILGGDITVGGEHVDPTNPLTVNGAYISANDIDWTAPDFTGWSGIPQNLFGPPHENAGIRNENNGPKTFTLRMKRTRTSGEFGIGAGNTTGFRNIRVDVLGSRDKVRGVLDLSDDPVDESSLSYREAEFTYNALRVTFFTDDEAPNPVIPVEVTNLFLKDRVSRVEPSSVDKWGVNPDVDAGQRESIGPLGGVFEHTDRDNPVPYYFSSSDPADTALKMIYWVIGNNTNGDPQEYRGEQDINGTTKTLLVTPVNLTDVNRAIAKGAPLLGDVYIYEDTTVTNGIPDDLSKVRGFIPAGDKQTQQALYRVPKIDFLGRRVVHARLISWSMSIIRIPTSAGNVRAEGYLMLMEEDDDESGRVIDFGGVSSSFSLAVLHGHQANPIIEPGSRLWEEIRNSTESGCVANGRFKLVLVTA